MNLGKKRKKKERNKNAQSHGYFCSESMIMKSNPLSEERDHFLCEDKGTEGGTNSPANDPKAL